MSADASNADLERIRVEIDAIDDEICNLLERRFDAVEQVRSAKSAKGRGTPIRPAREFAILSRLALRPDRMISTALKVRLWRIIMSASTLSQAPVSINVGAKVAGSVPLRLLIEKHYASIPVTVHESDEQALAAVAADAAGLCMVNPASAWAGLFLQGVAGDARIIGCLPMLRAAAVPDLLVLGHAAPEATGHDETIVIGNGQTRGTEARWRIAAGDHHVAAYPGFHQDTDQLSGDIAGSRGALWIAGHTSRLAEARS